MSTSPEAGLETCAACGATIYPEHLTRGAAERVSGRLLCAHCLAELRRPPATMPSPAPADAADGILILEDEAPPAPAASLPASAPKISYNEARAAVRTFRRPILKDRPHATRCRIFHCKLNDASMNNLYDQINEWVDGQDEIEIKFASSTIGIVEGKHPDPHLIVTVFY